MWGSLCKAPLLRLRPTFAAVSNVKTIHIKASPDYNEGSDKSKPLKFSTSKASHRHWTVAKSLGSNQQRPWWKVVPLSVFLTTVLLWAIFRKETDIDEAIYKPIEQLQDESENK
ncbi:hypothetical protein XENTR_v10024078 [Xenopus tropicalis]|uniref:Protein ccsmst1 n=2 Tax=Xenopus tropicalis TaxID=8364 RepID=B7ZTQ4_XENTR|nr:hypothetical protein LOC100127711 [Xenopus tropicalis]KAE8579526.1 hypothetical protein XENTR_v10024078 [Xenopus tropicalis]